MRQALDKVQHIDVARGLAKIGVGDGRIAEADVFGQRAGEEKRVLQDDGEVLAESGQVVLAQVDAVQKNLSGGHIVEAHHQAGEGGFSGAGVADDGDGLAGLDSEGNIFENPFDAGKHLRCGWRFFKSLVDGGLLLFRECLIGEPDVAKLNSVAAIAGEGRGGRDNLRLGIQEFKYALAGGHGRLQDVVLVAHVLDGPPEAQ